MTRESRYKIDAEEAEQRAIKAEKKANAAKIAARKKRLKAEKAARKQNR